MKRALVILAILTLVAGVASAQEPSDSRTLTLQFSGSVLIASVTSTVAPFFVQANFGAKGPLGQMTGQGLYLYDASGNRPFFVLMGQVALRVEATGEMLLLNVNPGPTAQPGSTPFSWVQTWAGTVTGGTGRFAGATGTFTKTATGLSAAPGGVQVCEGTIQITLDR